LRSGQVQTIRASTTADNYGKFGTSNIAISGSITSITNIDGVFWALGFNGTAPILSGLANGGALDTYGGWTLLASQISPAAYTNVSVDRLVKARDGGFLYCIAQNLDADTLKIMRSPAFPTPACTFTVRSSSPVTMSISILSGYGVSNTGTTHILVDAIGAVYRSSDGGATVAATFNSVGGAGAPVDVQYCLASRRWVVGSNSGPQYSDDDGVTWLPSIINNNNASAFSTYLKVIEPIDPAGRYLLGLASGTNGAILTYVSKDGGKNWWTSQVLQPPFFDDTVDRSATSSFALIHTGNRILIYQTGVAGQLWDWDYSMFESGLINLA